MTKQKITPYLWYDKEAKEAAEFYVSCFGQNSRIDNVTTMGDTPSGSVDIVSFNLLGHAFQAISAGPLFKLNPAISFHVRCKEVAEVDMIWEKVSPGGDVLMDIGEYDFSQRYGWIQDKYGVSWQIIHSAREFKQRIVPVFMFTQDLCGQAEAAVTYYASVFSNASSQVLARYAPDEAPDREGSVKFAEFILDGQEFGAMDSAHSHDFKFNEAISMMVSCQDQPEIDYFWDKLSAVPEAEQCGWAKDKYGVSWQIIPENMGELMGKNPARTTPVMLAMKKIVIADLEKAGKNKLIKMNKKEIARAFPGKI